MKIIRLLTVFLLMSFTFVLVSCEAGSSPYSVISIDKIGQTDEGFIYEIEFIDNNKYQFIVPFGVKGESGEKGDTPYIGHNGNWWIENQDLGIKAVGTDGINGIDGVTPYVGENGNWWIGNQDLYVLARGTSGVDGKDGETPNIGNNGNWWIGNQDLGVRAEGIDGPSGKDGVDGESPYIGNNGNWWIGNQDLGVRAEGVDGSSGKDGKDGVDGVDGQDGRTPYIGDNGNWWIGDLDTKVYAGSKNNSIPNTGSFEFAVNHDGESYVLISYDGKDRYVNIPKYHNGYPVSEIGKSVFASNKLITSVYIPNTIKKIDNGAFSDANNLENIIYEDNYVLEYIGSNSFSSTSLKEIIIPNTVKIIGQNAFENNNVAETIIFHENSKLEYIGRDSFKDASRVKEIVIPNSVLKIESGAFQGMNELELISLPFVGSTREYTNSIKNSGSMDEHLFGYIFSWRRLDNINNPVQIKNLYYQGQELTTTSIGRYMHYSIPTSLNKIVITDAEGLSKNSFYGLIDLEEIIINTGVEFIGDDAFGLIEHLDSRIN